MFADYHVHTSFSDDSEYEMEEVIKRAIQLGIEELCFTDHEDYLTNDIEQTHLVDYDAYEKRYRELKEKYAEQITLKFGMEFGIQSHMIQEFERDFVAHDFDFILLSNHQINDQEFWTGEFQKGKNQLEINSQYYEAILDVMGKYHNYSVLAHLDMIKRYDPYGILEDSICEEVIKQILKKAIKEEKALK